MSACICICMCDWKNRNITACLLQTAEVIVCEFVGLCVCVCVCVCACVCVCVHFHQVISKSCNGSFCSHNDVYSVFHFFLGSNVRITIYFFRHRLITYHLNKQYPLRREKNKELFPFLHRNIVSHI